MEGFVTRNMITEAVKKFCQETDSLAFVMEILAHYLVGIIGDINNHMDKEHKVDTINLDFQKPLTKFYTKKVIRKLSYNGLEKSSLLCNKCISFS